VALLLAAVGLYGVTAYTVAQANAGNRIRMRWERSARSGAACAGRGVPARLAGLLLGLPLAVGAGRLISSQLYGVSSWDPVAWVWRLARWRRLRWWRRLHPERGGVDFTNERAAERVVSAIRENTNQNNRSVSASAR